MEDNDVRINNDDIKVEFDEEDDIPVMYESCIRLND